jgi:hypothetical protein
MFRLCLGLIVAFVFAGRVEAATQHCVRLAHEALAISAAAEPCHMMGMDHSAPAKVQTHHSQPMGACECIAFAKSVSAPLPLLASSRIAAFAWERPAVESVASLDLAPDGPPPKA